MTNPDINSMLDMTVPELLTERRVCNAIDLSYWEWHRKLCETWSRTVGAVTVEMTPEDHPDDPEIWDGGML